MTEHLPSSCKAWGSISSTENKKQIKQRTVTLLLSGGSCHCHCDVPKHLAAIYGSSPSLDLLVPSEAKMTKVQNVFCKLKAVLFKVNPTISVPFYPSRDQGESNGRYSFLERNFTFTPKACSPSKTKLLYSNLLNFVQINVLSRFCTKYSRDLALW